MAAFVGNRLLANQNTDDIFENRIATYAGSKYAVSVDCCTNALELSIRITDYANIKIPLHTYVSVPYMLIKNG